MEKNSVEGSIVTLAHKDLLFMVERETREREAILALVAANVRSVRIKKDLYCGLCQTAVFCSYVLFDRRAEVKFENTEMYEVPEGFVDQGIDKGRCHLMCLICAEKKLRNSPKVKPAHVNLMVHWELADMKELCRNTKNSIVDYEKWEDKILKFSEKSGSLAEFKKFLTLGSKYSTTRRFQQVRQTVEEAEKARVLVSEVFEGKMRPCLSRDDLASFCHKVKSFPFRIERTELLEDELSKVDSVLDELKDDDLSFDTCEALVAREKALRLDIIDMKKIRELQSVIKFLPKLDKTFHSLEEAKTVLDQVREVFCDNLSIFDLRVLICSAWNTTKHSSPNLKVIYSSPPPIFSSKIP